MNSFNEALILFVAFGLGLTLMILAAEWVSIRRYASKRTLNSDIPRPASTTKTRRVIARTEAEESEIFDRREEIRRAKGLEEAT